MDNFIEKSLEELNFLKTAEVYATLCLIQSDKEKLVNLKFSSSATQLLISLQRHSELCEISLHIFNHSCQSIVHDFIKYGGFEYLIQIINSTLNELVLNQACILLSKLVNYRHVISHFVDITATRAIPSIVEFLSRTENVDFQYTVCHTLMILAKIPKVKQSIVWENGTESVAKLLHSSNTKLLLCSIKTSASLIMANSTLGYFPDLELTAKEVGMIEILLQFLFHHKETVQNYALFTLMELSYQRDIAGFRVVTGFVKSLYTRKSLELKHLVLQSLACCFMTWNVWKNHKTEAVFCLKHLVNILKDKMLNDIHIHILKLLQDICYNCEISNILLDFDLLETLLNMLKGFTQQNNCFCFSECSKIQSSDERHASYKTLREDECCSFELLTKLLFDRDLTFDDSDIFKFDDCLSKYKSKNDLITCESIDNNVLSLLNDLKRLHRERVNVHLIKKENYIILLEYAYFIRIRCSAWSSCTFFQYFGNYYFEKLVLNGFVLELERFLPDGQYRRDAHCSMHSRYMEKDVLWEIGRSNAVVTLFNLLKTGENSVQLLVMHAISRFIASKRYLKMALDMNGLQILIKFLGCKSVYPCKIAAVTIREMYNSIKNIWNRLETENSNSCMFYTGSFLCCYEKSDFDVKFLVDCGEAVGANRELICKRSEYFNALLASGFMEESLNSVNLHGISKENILTIFHFLHGCGPSSTCDYIKGLPFPHLIELLADSDKFLLEKFKKVIEIEVQHHLCYLNIPKVYEQAKICNFPCLAEKALEMALDKPVKHIFRPDEWWNCFDELLNLDLSLNFCSDVVNVITKLADT